MYISGMHARVQIKVGALWIKSCVPHSVVTVWHMLLYRVTFRCRQMLSDTAQQKLHVSLCDATWLLHQTVQPDKAEDQAEHPSEVNLLSLFLAETPVNYSAATSQQMDGSAAARVDVSNSL